jgi:hypothetical protein
MSKAMKSLFVLSLAMLGNAGDSLAANLPARAGKSDFPSSEPGCWAPNGPSVTNVCGASKLWWMPVPNAGGNFWLTVVAQGANFSSNVKCNAMSADFNGGSFFSASGWVNLPQFGSPKPIAMAVNVPFNGGVAMVDCDVLPGGKLHTMYW